MKKFMALSLLVGIPAIYSGASWAETASCEIRINDINKGTVYTLNEKFTFKEGGAGQRKHFDLPGQDYSCTLAFFDKKIGTMISCAYKPDMEQTFFQSDRTGIKMDNGENTLTFRHKSAYINLETICK